MSTIRSESAEPRADFLGRWTLIRPISQSASSCVLLAEDRAFERRRCVLKLVETPTREDLEAAQREFRTLRQLEHPFLVRVYDFGRAGSGGRRGSGLQELWPASGGGDLAYIVFSHFDGDDLRQAFVKLVPAAAARGKRRPAARARRWRLFLEAVGRICLGLEYIHSRGLVHYDIKPENLLLAPRGSGDPPGGHDVKIIDFGLCEQETTPLGTRARGTVPYIAPEILTDGAGDRRSDLFSLGVALGYAVTGRHLFPGDNAARWVEAARAGEFEQVSRLCPEAPPGFSDLVSALLSPAPEERPQSALDVVAVLERLGGFSLEKTKRAIPAPVPTIGWERQLNVLEGELEALRRGETSRPLVVLERDPGQFTENFLEEVRAMARTEGVEFVAGSCARPCRFPYQPLSEALQKLSRRIDFSAEPWKRYAGVLRLFVPGGGAPGGEPEAAQGAVWFVDQLTRMFLGLAREAPLMLVIRDLHLADEDLLAVVKSIARNLELEREEPRDGVTTTSTPPSRLLIVATVQAHDETSEDDRRGLKRVRAVATEPFSLRLSLNNLAPEEVAEWAAARAPAVKLPARFLQKVHEISGGSPRHVDQCLKWLASTPEAPESRSNDAFPPLQEAGEAALMEKILHLPQTEEEDLLDRYNQLSARDRLLLESLATAGSAAVPEDVVGEIEERLERDATLCVRLDEEPLRPVRRRSAVARPEDTAERLRRLADDGFLEARDAVDGTEWCWSMEPLRRTLYRQCAEPRRRELHRLMAQVLIERFPRQDPGRAPEEIAHQARRGGLDDEYRFHALLAADRLRAAYALERAAGLYEEVLSSTPVDEAAERVGNARSLRWVLSEKLVEVYRQKGVRSRARDKLTDLLSLCRQPQDSGAIYRKMGEVYLEGGNSNSAAYYLEQSLQALSADLPPSLWPESQRRELCSTLIALTRFHLGEEDLEKAHSRIVECLKILEIRGGPQELLCEAYLLLAQIHHQRNDHDHSLAFNLKAVGAADSAGNADALSRAISATGNTLVSQGKYDDAIAQFQRGLEVATRSANKARMAQFHSDFGTVYHHRGDSQHALECFQRSLGLSRQIGNTRAIANSYNNLGTVYRVRDETARAAECYKLAIDLYSKTRDQFGMATGMTNLASILEEQGKFNEALEYSFRALEKRKRLKSRSRLASSYYRIGRIYQSKGELQKAVNYAQRGIQLRKELGEKMDIAYSQLQLAELQASQARLYEAHELARESLETFRKLENPIGQLLAREVLARATAQMGMLDAAKAELDDIAAAARAEGQQPIVGRCLLELGAIAVEAGDLRDGEEHLAEAEKLFRQTRNQRQIVETLLARSALQLELGHWEHAGGHLEEAYSMLEALGIRDLVPWYFLLRSRLEAGTGKKDLEAARKFLQRGMVEAREANLPQLHWRFHYRIGRLERRRRDFHLARIHFNEAKKILEGVFKTLPPRFREKFYEPRDRAALLKVASESRRKAVPPERASPTPLPVSLPAQPTTDPGIEAGIHQELIKLHEVASAIGTEKDLVSLLERIMDAVLDLVNAERGFLIVKDPAPGQSPITVARNLDREAVPTPQTKISESIADKVLRSGVPVLSGNALDEKQFKRSKSIHNLRLKSLLCVPLKFRDEILGVIYLDNRYRRHAFEESDLKTLQTFSDQAAVAIKNAGLIEENRRREARLERANRELDTRNIKLLSKVHQRTVQFAAAKSDLDDRQKALENRYHFASIKGKSKAMLDIFFLLERLCHSDLPVLLQGESGTGKGLIAKAIHFNSGHRQGRFVSENCGALTETLLETELFGHERGAFTGAVREKKGLFELAHKGTLFLDEVADMSLGMQQKVLRVLQQGEFRPVGGKDLVQVDVRVISASNRDLLKLVAEGKFREDLYYRLNGARIHVPPLRERPEDIPILVEHFLDRLASERDEPPRRFSPRAMRVLMSRPWPGNVRELRHFLEKTVLITPENVIDEEALVFEASPSRASGADGDGDASSGTEPDNEALAFRQARDRFERRYVERMLARTRGNVARASKESGLSRESFYRLLRKHGIAKPSKGSS